jgi:hypothetical protein
VKLRYFRFLLRTFAVGLAAVWIVTGLETAWRDKTVDLPKASEEVLPVFIGTQRVLTPQKNCGKDPHDPQARLDCVNEKLYERRDLSAYRYNEIRCDFSVGVPDAICASADARLRALIWEHWQRKERAQIVEHLIGNGWNDDLHYFIEPNVQGQWRIVVKDVYPRSYLVDDLETPIQAVLDAGIYVRVNWTLAIGNDASFVSRVGIRCLRLVDETGDDWFI